MINEIHYDNDGGDAGEFIELVSAFSLVGYSVVLYNGATPALATLYRTTVIPAGPGPTPVPSAGVGPTSQTVTVTEFVHGGLVYTVLDYPTDGIQNGGSDGILLVDTNGAIVEFLSYEGVLTASNGPAVAVGQSTTDIVVTETSSTVVGSSLQRIVGSNLWEAPKTNTRGFPNGIAAPVPAPVSVPVAAPVPAPVPAPVAAPVPALVPVSTTPTTLIHAIQGTGAPATTAFVSVTAIVTSLFFNSDAVSGFWMQEEDSDIDADPNTSEGIFVNCTAKCPSTLAVGNQVKVLGNTGQSFTTTRIDASISTGSVTILSIGNPLPTPILLTLPASASTLLESTFQNVEGMLVTFSTKLFVSEYFELARFGQIVLTETSVPLTYTQENLPSMSGFTAATAALEKRRIILDDDNSNSNDAITGTSDEPYYYPTGGLSLANKFRAGDSITNLSGVMQHDFDAWRVRPSQAYTYTFAQENVVPASPANVGGTLRVTSFNVLNYFTTIDTTSSTSSGPCGPLATQDCRGADSSAELTRQTAKIVSALVKLNPDIAGLIELQNSATDAAISALVSALNSALGSATYSYIPTGFIGGDAIVVGLIYKSSVVSPVNSFRVLDSTIDPIFIDTSNRPVLIQSFQQIATGARFTVSVCHFKSKGSPCSGDPDKNDGQSECPNTRRDAATALVNYLNTDPTSSGDPDHLIIGDLNSYAKEDTIIELENAGFTDVVAEKAGSKTYSYLFSGQRGTLDYVFASTSLLPQVTGATVWNINSDEIPIFDYNDGVFDNPGEATFNRISNALPLYAPNELRSSDHDPALVGFSLTAPSTNAPTKAPAKAPTKAPNFILIASLSTKAPANVQTKDFLTSSASLRRFSLLSLYLLWMTMML